MTSLSIDSKVPRVGFSVDETAERIGVSANTVWNMIRRGDIAVVRIGRRTIVPEFAITQYMHENAKQKVPTK